ncbi:Asp-tRNA(Asn)/Glu-tRNA(Gln) amidotransferase GatCAB subunit B [Candidatus Micrarchaeota archaeon CG_4_10_14_0_2_um_filter_49_7]|nr:MAG: Asp-tRNA(Asn)/Glu-tRNA(Gln) amidotransferase GatCAB subunit B [Candidatus Micrarchaeota archaeon CG06_land_8_20_14_3_00_50_6]PIZ99926.1 MAG: Asp-tRNA(Asn)/Glu-tRNA(Gln) amidotransferase GatCAB subunit B [Candidatus Micrarchaeota archaeon CG_4_10_14_0_2_um_filter_49_7]
MFMDRVIIGLEIHAQLRTDAKLFCECSAKYRDIEPNTNLCPTCTSQPGGKPMSINGRALENLEKLAIALGAKFEPSFYFMRKHYFYPDLPSNYQRTSTPIASDGMLRNVRIRELHLEEDPGRYELRNGEVDLNRSGVPLVEIVTDPDMRSPEEARLFLQELQAINDYIDSVREEPGSMKIDANVSLAGGNRVEIKNINSFKGVVSALTYEITRQSNLLRNQKTVAMETRHYSEKQGITMSLRKKETSEDYRYVPDPDMLGYDVDGQEVEKLRKGMPELPAMKVKRFVAKFGIKEDDAEVIAGERALADFFEGYAKAKKFDCVKLAQWLRGDLKKQLNYRNLAFGCSKVDRKTMELLLEKYFSGKLTDRTMEQILIAMLDGKFESSMLGQEKISDTGYLEEIANKVIGQETKAAGDYRKGEEKAINFLAGKVMKESRGRGDIRVVLEILKKKLGMGTD